MHEEIIKAQKDNSLTVNYNKWIFDNICHFIGERVLDVGSGCGNSLRHLLPKETIVVVEILDFFIEELRRDYGLHKNVHIFKYDIQDYAVIEAVRGYGINTVICNNVLEHVRDDQKALDNMRKILSGCGNLILVLPAFQFLYSRWDKAIGHFRRYNYKDIKEKLLRAGFLVHSKFYMNSIGLFAWFLNGKILNNTPRTGYFIKEQAVFFDRHIVEPLKKLENLVRPSFGQSLIIIARPL